MREAGEMLQFYGPKTAAELASLLPFDDRDAILNELVDGEDLVRGNLVAGSAAEYFCDADNLETLIRFQRAAARPGFEPRPAMDLAPFLADWQGFGADPTTERFLDVADRLRGFAAPVNFWLDEAFAPRQPGATPAGSRIGRGQLAGLAWRGAGEETVRIGFGEDFDLLGAPGDAGGEAAELFKDPRARYTFLQLFDESEMDAQTFNAAFWDAVWAGRLAADGFAALDAARVRRYELAMGARASRWRERVSGYEPFKSVSGIRAVQERPEAPLEECNPSVNIRRAQGV